jgi:outer membrane protein assembly factor BamA
MRMLAWYWLMAATLCMGISAAQSGSQSDGSTVLPWSVSSPAAIQDARLDSLRDAGYWLAKRSDTLGHPGMAAYSPGPIHLLDSITLEIQPAIPAVHAALSTRVQNFKGLRASRATWEDLRQALEGFLRDSGFPLATYRMQIANPAVVPNPDAEPLHVWIRLELHEGFKFGGLLSQGSRTTSATLLRLSLLEYGETFQEGRTALGISRLRRTGYFDAVDSVGMVRDSDRNLIYPLLKLNDALGNRIGGLLGYDSEAESDALSGFIDIHLVNIRGTGRDFDFKFDSRPQGNGRSDRQVQFQYLEPWLPGLPLGLRATGSIWLQDSLYDQIDGSLALLHELDMHSRLEITFARQWSLDRISDLESQSVSGGLALILDHRNQVPSPSRGFYVDARSQGIRRELGDSSRYLIQSQFTGHIYVPLTSRFLLHGKGDVGGIWPRHPLALRGDRFDLGGARTLRGYREREFSTDLYGYAQLEGQWLLAGQSRVLAFLSPGLVDKQTPSLWWTPVFGYGVGLEMGSKAWAVGLLYALNPKRNWGQGFIHITVDNRF